MTTARSDNIGHILPAELQNRIIIRTETLSRQASDHFNLRLKPLKVIFNITGSAWGYYVRNNITCCIRYNPWLFAQYLTEGLDDTVPHEVAHYLVDMRYRRRCKPHGSEWREIMHFFGIEKPRATARYNLDGIPVRRQRRHIYHCDCQSHEISTTRHYRILRGLNYNCLRCGSTLRLKQPLDLQTGTNQVS